MIFGKRRIPIYNPEDDSDLFYWFDAADESTLKTSGGSPISNNDQVYEWINKKGSQKFVQAGSITRPTWTNSAPGNKKGIRFAGSHALAIDNLSGLTSLDGTTTIVVASVDNPSTAQTVLSLYGATAPAGNRVLIHCLSGNMRIHCRQNDSHSGVIGEDGSLEANKLFLGTTSANYLTGKTVYFRDGVIYQQSLFDTTGTSPTTSPSSFAIGRQGTAFSLGGNEQWMTGYIYEVLFWRKALTPQELVSAHTYLKIKWKFEPSLSMTTPLLFGLSSPEVCEECGSELNEVGICIGCYSY